MKKSTNHEDHTENSGQSVDRRGFGLGRWRRPLVFEWRFTGTVWGCPGSGLGVERTEVLRQLVTWRDIRDVWWLGLGVERNSVGSLQVTKKELGSWMCLWTESSTGTIKPGSSKKWGKIGVKQQGVMYVRIISTTIFPTTCNFFQFITTDKSKTSRGGGKVSVLWKTKSQRLRKLKSLTH